MDSNQYLNIYKEIQSKIYEFIENDENSDENFSSLQELFNKNNNNNDKHNLALLFHLIIKIANNHRHDTSFFDKIDKIITLFLEDIKKYYSNSEIFNIFKSNKRILLFLYEQNLFIFDKSIVLQITSGKYIRKKYPEYFAPEIKPFINENWFPKIDKNYDSDNPKNAWIKALSKELPEDFYENRKIGENENYICKLIRNDLIEEFVIYVTKNNYSLRSTINNSIYETNSFLLKFKHNLIEYAAFFGSTQIFQHLRLNDVEIPDTLIINAIHGKNAEIIHILENDMNNRIYKICFFESIKCHHNEIANYFLNNIEQNEDEDFLDRSNSIIFKYYDFDSISRITNIQSLFYAMCKYDYYFLACHFLDKVDINEKKVFDLFV